MSSPNLAISNIIFLNFPSHQSNFMPTQLFQKCGFQLPIRIDSSLDWHSWNSIEANRGTTVSNYSIERKALRIVEQKFHNKNDMFILSIAL